MAEWNIFVCRLPRLFDVNNYPGLPGGAVFAPEINAAPERMCAGRVRIEHERERAVSGNKKNFATWLDDSNELDRGAELAFTQFFPEEIRSEGTEVGSDLHSGKPADNTAQLLSILRDLVGAILEAQLDVRSYDVYLIA
jgi:hypothetical protein